MEEGDEFQDCYEGPGSLKPSAAIGSGRAKETVTQPGHEESEVSDVVQDLQGLGLADQEDQEVMEKNIDKALAYKEEGNTHFRNKDFDFACQAYSWAIDSCPTDNTEQLATFYGNRAAAHFSEDEHDQVVEDCTKALELKADYVKVLARRMQSLEKLGKLDEALADAKKIQELEPAYPKITSTVNRLQKAYDEKMNAMKDEAMGKLKELGNSILGNFGMSLDNFKMAQDPATGSWSISMNK